MTETEAIKLIEKADLEPNVAQKWADLGCGSGLFSYALATLLPRESRILAIDKVNHAPFRAAGKGVKIEFFQADFTKEVLPSSDLDGILMANSLHYVKTKRRFLEKLNSHLNKRGRMLIVEYDTSQSNPWVPYPIPFSELKEKADELGYAVIRKIGERPSRYGNKNMYAAELGL